MKFILLLSAMLAYGEVHDPFQLERGESPKKAPDKTAKALKPRINVRAVFVHKSGRSAAIRCPSGKIYIL